MIIKLRGQVEQNVILTTKCCIMLKRKTLSKFSEMPIPFIEFTGISSLMSVKEKYWKCECIVNAFIAK